MLRHKVSSAEGAKSPAEFFGCPSGYKQALLESEEGIDKPIGLYRKFLYTGKYRKSQGKDKTTHGRSK